MMRMSIGARSTNMKQQRMTFEAAYEARSALLLQLLYNLLLQKASAFVSKHSP